MPPTWETSAILCAVILVSGLVFVRIILWKRLTRELLRSEPQPQRQPKRPIWAKVRVCLVRDPTNDGRLLFYYVVLHDDEQFRSPTLADRIEFNEETPTSCEIDNSAFLYDTQVEEIRERLRQRAEGNEFVVEEERVV